MKKWVCILGTILAVYLVVLVFTLLLGGDALGTNGGAPVSGTEEQTSESPEPGGEELSSGENAESGEADDESGTGTMGGEVDGESGAGPGNEVSDGESGADKNSAAETLTGDASMEDGTEAAGESTAEESGTASLTTEPPTTAAPSTAAPTAAPTTAAPTTAAPTTAAPTTAAPTTAAPTTAAPTTPAVQIPDGTGLWQELTMTEQEALARGKVVYLTFDDGPSRHTEKLLQILEKYNVKATFFVTGQFDDFYGRIAEAKNAGHTIASHTYSHEYAEVYASDDSYFADLKQIEDIILAQTGEVPKLLRFPGGSSNQVSRNYNIGIMTRLTAEVEARGYHYFDWNVTSGDAGGGSDTREKVAQKVIAGIQSRSVSVVLQHDIYEYSVAAVEDIIVWGLSNGYIFLPMSMDTPVVHHGVAN